MKKFKILIVDDNPHFAKALHFMLFDSFSNKIEEINIVNDGIECLSELGKKFYDIVFMDISMPNMGGIETTKQATQMYRNLVVIAVSFHSEMNYVIQMIEAGARNYIIKDQINIETLEKVLSVEYSY
ncbi:MAG: response regulator transcription factor [Bacteroidales bacterium]|nr:response regulator transcription factor [Bacteroidales bacterium]